MLSLRCVFLFSMASINCSQGEKEVESGDAHQHRSSTPSNSSWTENSVL